MKKETERVLIGVILTGVVGVVSACVLNFLGFLLADGNASNGVLYDDGFLILKFLSCICAIAFSLAYFRKFKQLSKSVLGFHFLVIVVIVWYFASQHIAIRREQHQVLLKYQEFRQALLDKDYQKAYELMTPAWRKEHSVDDVKEETEGFIDLGPEDSIYSVHVYGDGWAEIVPNPHTSWWFRPAAGASWMFEEVGSEWYVSPRNINFYLPYSNILTSLSM